MVLDLKKDQAKAKRYIEKRIRDYPKFFNHGPGEDEDPVSLLTVGYYAAQGGYMNVVFNTRPNADLDGEWTLHIEDDLNTLNLPHWCRFFESVSDGKPEKYFDHTGMQKLMHFKGLNEDTEISDRRLTQLNAIFGEMLACLLQELRDSQAFKSLPLTKNAFMVVEEFDGCYGWPTYNKRKILGRIAP